MVIRRVESAARGASGRRSWFAGARSTAACLGLATALVCQQPEAPPAGGQPPAPPAAPPAAATPAPAAQDPAPASIAYGRIVADQAQLRCWSGAVAQPPVFDEVLTKGQVVVLGRSENGFRAVQLPLGPVGFVSRKFAESTPEGLVKTKGTKVAFRFRPRSSEAPVLQLDNGTPLHVVGEQDEWFRVRVPGVDAWIAEGEVQAIDAKEADAAAKVYGELRAKHEGEVKARLDAIGKLIARATQDKADLAAVQVIDDAFTTELKKPLGEQKFEPLNEALDKLAQSLAAESAGRGAVEALKKRLETQRWIAEATAARDARPPITDAPPADKKDQLERFQSIGWLRYERRLAGPGLYYLEKGGQRQYLLSCNTGRYDLAMFVDCEVGVMGPRRRPVTESLSVLDVERMEVLGVASK